MTAVAWEEDIEAAIVERLKAALAPLPVEALPEKQWNFTHAKGAVLVMFTGADISPSLDMFTSAQTMTLNYEVLLCSRSLRSHTGLFKIWAATRTALLGWRPDCGTPMLLKSLRNAGYEDGAWYWSCVFTTQALLVADAETDIGPLLKQVTFEDETA